MRWLYGVLATLLVLMVLYAGSAFASLKGLVEAVRASNAEEVLTRTDVARVKRSLVDQIVGAYLLRTGEKRPLKSVEKILANTYGASIADALVGKLLTKGNLTELLRNGEIKGDIAAGLELPRLKPLDLSDLAGLVGRISLVKPVEFAVRLGDGENSGGISFHFEGDLWRLSGVQLPAKAVQALAATLPTSK